MNYNPKDYRPNVGMMIINSQKKIFVGKRLDHPSDFWQMPQGGIDGKENPEVAALREMEEEVGIKKNKVKLLSQLQDWHYYSIPEELALTLWKGKFKGQRQKWFLFEFLGSDKDINIHTEHPEFSDYQWVDKEFLVPNIVPFKREIYSKLLEEFKNYL
ncbi:MAG: RNA pyrophosphohydrolase [Pelagibacteraceae bacterium]|jgi:putative (di)nucleoside polyphosphate hydrolase